MEIDPQLKEELIQQEVDKFNEFGVLGIEVKRSEVRGKPVLRTHVVIEKKIMPDGSEVLRARVVARGDLLDLGRVQYGTSPVATLVVVRLVLAIAVKFGWEIQTLDVVGAFLTVELDEEVYIDIRGHVYPLLRALYGMVESGRQWYEKYHSILVDEMGFDEILPGHNICVYVNWDRKIIVVLFVDDT
jgi:hypothetical protein